MANVNRTKGLARLNAWRAHQRRVRLVRIVPVRRFGQTHQQRPQLPRPVQDPQDHAPGTEDDRDLKLSSGRVLAHGVPVWKSATMRTGQVASGGEQSATASRRPR
jgi:hypothetical protein